MNKKLIAVSDFSDVTMVEYVNSQINAISNAFTQLSIEHVNYDNSIMQTYANYPERIPAFFILKDNKRVAVLQAKVSTEKLTEWVNQFLG